MFQFRKLLSVALVLSLLGLSSCRSENTVSETDSPIAPNAYGGPMGFTPWPYDFTEKAQEDTYRFIHENANLISHHLDGGIPWPEALKNKKFSKHLIQDWKRRKANTPAGYKVLLSLTPINFARDGLAPYWGKSDNMALPDQWEERHFDDPDVVIAYRNYVLRAIEHFEPDFLAIGIEANMIITKKPEQWDNYVTLNRKIYRAVKKQHPALPTFATVQYEHLRGKEAESEPNLHLQRPAVDTLMKASDMLALSTYRFGFVHNKYDENFFDEALSFNKQVAIAEMGAMSKTTKVSWLILPASENDQHDHMKMVLEAAQKNDFAFVVNWVAIDYDQMIDKLPKELAEISKAWVHTGLMDDKGQRKKALEIWRKHLRQSVE